MDPFESNKQAETKSVVVPEGGKLQPYCRIMMYLHLLMVPLVIFLGDKLVGLIDWLGGALFSMPKIQTNANDFWKVPIIGLLVMLAFSFFRVWRDRTRIHWLQPVCIVYGILAASYLTYYFLDLGSLAYLMAMLASAGIAIATFYFWWVYKP